ncbi:hypothetical protein [Skermania piniformis]|uniref:Uncharacterized protein n=1 Tax=Skermania pinensis TaxID=39122 RepID=A0ABX8S868_9ACTN|nr:hypothetical protein [Skermania piniformis]QXQ14048.1 hypothetical protein KV203_00835 [Skermania piniformis]
MASIQTLERRIALLEARLNELEGGYGESIYAMRREQICQRIILERIAVTGGADAGVSGEEIDQVLDE